MKRLRIKIKKDSQIVPPFIDTRKNEDYLSFNLMSGHIFPSINKCCVKKFYSYYDIDLIGTDIFFALSEISDYSDTLYLHIYKYIIERLKEYEKFAEDIEMYEAAGNFSKLLEILTGKKRTLYFTK